MYDKNCITFLMKFGKKQTGQKQKPKSHRPKQHGSHNKCIISKIQEKYNL